MTILTLGPGPVCKALVGAEGELEETEDFFTMLEEGLFREDSLALAGGAFSVFVSYDKNKRINGLQIVNKKVEVRRKRNIKKKNYVTKHNDFLPVSQCHCRSWLELPERKIWVNTIISQIGPIIPK